jgi:hypothetical protein
MKAVKKKSGGVNMFAIKSFINLISVKFIFILLICVLMGFSLGCSAEGEINGGSSGMGLTGRGGLVFYRIAGSA